MKKLIKNGLVAAMLLLSSLDLTAQENNKAKQMLQEKEMKEQVFIANLNTPELKSETVQSFKVDDKNKGCCSRMGHMNMQYGEMKEMMMDMSQEGEGMCKMMMEDGEMGMMKNMEHGEMGMMDMENPSSVDLQGESALLVNYNALKNALVEDKPKEVKEAASQMIKNLEGSKVAKKKRSQLHENLREIANSDDLKKQRQQFAQLSEELYQLVKNNDLTDKTLYLQYCSMAMGGQGANWLSYEKQVRNPYMGQRMPGCGSVKEVIE